YESRRDAFISACKKIGLEAVAPAGSFFAWIPVPENFTSSEFADYLLEEVSVAVADGSGVGEFGEGYVRVGRLMDEARLEEAVPRVSKLHLFETV
ncbi:aminotransferase class I/II-fold pyridoxal phosphate-dependent enzyme, partial [Listeria monocytogenes]|nr:aminotransferase class I/II-fold pyridoxal phosphate-dependent enzyme [Listeria monocytogenes]